MKFGVHVSIANGIENAPINAHKRGCEVFQFFSRSPRGGKPTYTSKSIQEFKDNCKKLGFNEYYIHTPYYINLASASDRIRLGSIQAIREELEVGTKLEVKYVMTHLGSAKDFDDKIANKMVIAGLKQILKGYKGTTILLLENSAGSGKIIGSKLEDLGNFIKKINSKKIGLCFDTCHGFASGYDIRTKQAVNKTIKQIETIVGLENLKLFHLNDSKTEFNSNKDRHENLGQGLIGQQAFELLINHPKLKKINSILETPDSGEEKIPSLQLAKRLRK